MYKCPCKIERTFLIDGTLIGKLFFCQSNSPCPLCNDTGVLDYEPPTIEVYHGIFSDKILKEVRMEYPNSYVRIGISSYLYEPLNPKSPKWKSELLNDYKINYLFKKIPIRWKF